MQPQCDQLTVNGDPCKKHAMEGSTRCAAHLGLVGPKTLLTDDVADKLVQLLSAGNYVQVAARACGIARRTFAEWCQRGEQGEEPYASFAERIVEARAIGESRNVALIARAAADNWQAAAWMLERQYPDRWGRSSVRLRDTPEPAPEVVVDRDDPFAEVDQLAELRQRRDAS
jgi:hypothetical protein